LVSVFGRVDATERRCYASRASLQTLRERTPLLNAPIKRRIVLGSTSRYRRALLTRLQIPFITAAPNCDERAWSGLSPDLLAVTLARAKATSIPTPGSLIIGSDQVVDLGGEILHKPGTEAAACAQLAKLSGRTHRLITAVAVHDTVTGATLDAVDIHTMHMRTLSEAQIARYIAHDKPLDCAGSYMLEKRGIALFERIEADPETADDSAIVGLPVMKTLTLLRRLGYEILDV
jgi:septum formation protein